MTNFLNKSRIQYQCYTLYDWYEENEHNSMPGETAEEMEMADYMFFTQDKLIETCSLTLSLTKWNGMVFENFDSSDKYSAGFTGEVYRKNEHLCSGPWEGPRIFINSF